MLIARLFNNLDLDRQDSLETFRDLEEFNWIIVDFKIIIVVAIVVVVAVITIIVVS